MINLTTEVHAALETVLEAEDEFATMFKGLAVMQSSKLEYPLGHKVEILAALTLHLIANLVEAQAEIGQLKGQMALLRTDLNILFDIDTGGEEDEL